MRSLSFCKHLQLPSIDKSTKIVGFGLLIVFVFVYRNYFIYGKTRLHEYGDTLHHVRQIDHVSEKILSLKFLEALSLPHFYPTRNTIFYSDTLIPQALMVLPFRPLVGNPITLFNIAFLTNSFLVMLSAFFLVRRFTKNTFLSFVGVLLFTFNPFFVYHKGHFQLLVVWPIYLVVAIVFDLLERFNLRIVSFKSIITKSLFVSILLVILLYSSPYLLILFFPLYAIFTIFSIKRKILEPLFVFNFFVLFIFGMFSVPYFLNMKRVMGEVIPHPDSSFVLHSASVTDYFYWYPVNGGKFLTLLWHSVSGGGERAFYPVFVLNSFCLSLVFYVFKPGRFLKFIKRPVVSTLIIVSMLAFIFSLGPYLKLHGVATNISLPGRLLLKLPFFSGMRAMSRWVFLLAFSITFYFFLLIDGILVGFVSNSRFRVMAVLMLLLPLIYLVPRRLVLQEANLLWSYEPYSALPIACEHNLIEVPNVTGFKNRPASYHKLIFFSTTFHQCNLLNGYASFSPKSYIYMWRDLDLLEADNVLAFLKSYDVGYLKINLLDIPDKNQVMRYQDLFSLCLLREFPDHHLYDCTGLL